MGMICSTRTFAQSLTNHCFAINLIKDGKNVDSPKFVTFLDKTTKKSSNLQDGKFCVPDSMANKTALDVSFVSGHERFYLARIPISRCQSSWVISFGETDDPRLPKGLEARKACTVVFRNGEPEIGIILSACRVPDDKMLN